MEEKYYTAESVRNQLLQIAEIDPFYTPPDFPDNWMFCPCFKVRNGTCYNGHCKIRLGVFLKEPSSRFPIEILYIKQKQGGFIRASTPRLKNLIDDGVINRAYLTSESF